MKTKLIPADYVALLSEIKELVRTAQYDALRCGQQGVDGPLLGHRADDRADVRQKDSWGKAMVERLAADLQVGVPGCWRILGL